MGHAALDGRAALLASLLGDTILTSPSDDLLEQRLMSWHRLAMIRSISAIAITVSANLLACGAWAQSSEIKNTLFLSGNDLYQRCTTPMNASDGLANFGFCRGYIYGYFDSILTRLAEDGGSACLKSGVTNTQVVDVVVQYLRDNPATRHEPADFAVLKAVATLVEPCSSAP